MCEKASLQCIGSVVFQGGPILSVRDGLAITMGREGLQVWDITEPMPVLLETIPRRYGKMRLDLMCLTGDADNQLSEFLRREEEV